jgi:hypothetical protein
MLLWGAVMLLASVVVSAREADQAPDSTRTPAAVVESGSDALPNPNPAARIISPRLGQSATRQRADERACFDEATARTGWNPYDGWAALVDAGYARALTDEEIAAGLVAVAADGAVTGSVAGDLLGDEDTGAEIGTAVALAREIVRSEYLLQHENSAARRAVADFERHLRRWERKYAACLRPRGYAVSGHSGP